MVCVSYIMYKVLCDGLAVSLEIDSSTESLVYAQQTNNWYANMVIC